MMRATVDERVERLQVTLNEINILGDQALSLISSIAKDAHRVGGGVEMMKSKITERVERL